MVYGDMLRQWVEILSEKKGESLDLVYVYSNVDIVGQLWLGIGKELGQILRFFEEFGEIVWSKDGVILFMLKDFGLVIGNGEGYLVSMKDVIKELGMKL